jgi:O-methyltransferase
MMPTNRFSAIDSRIRRLVSRLQQGLEHRALDSTSRSVSRAGLTYLSPRKLHRLHRAMARVQRSGSRGEFVEFGVALGGSAVVIARQALAQGRSFHGFDVFEMIPAPRSEKDDELSRERYRVIEQGLSVGIDGSRYYGYRDGLYDEVLGTFTRYRVPVDGKRVALHKGLFEKTWPGAELEHIALAHIDCDWYDPVKYCLNAVSDRLSVGGILVLDDYYAYGGCRTAVHEFLAANPRFELEYGSNPFLVKRE